MHQWGSRSSKTQNAHIGFRESGIFWGTFFFCQSQKDPQQCTVDGGTGIDDYTCLLSSEGEVLIYKGYNPNDASNWTLMGSYKLSKPIGYQCVMQYQGDVVLITQEGYIPLSKALSTNNTGFSSVAFSDKISGLVSERARFYKDFEGWQSLIYTKRGYGIFNVPLGEQFEQHVINVATGSWCRFTNIRAFCWCLHGSCSFFMLL